MAKITTLGRELVKRTLPEEYQVNDTNKPIEDLTYKELEQLLVQLAKDKPQYYKDVSHKLLRLGSEFSYTTGITAGLSDISPVIDGRKLAAKVEEQVDAIRENPKLSPEQKDELIRKVYAEAQKFIDEATYEKALQNKNQFAIQVKAKARGSKSQLSQMLTTPLYYTDNYGNIIPITVKNSYADGLTPAEMFASSFGARKGVVSTKFCLAKGTLILLSDFTAKPIEDIEPGDEVFTLDPFTGKLIPTKVKQLFNNGLKFCYKYNFKSATYSLSISSTEDHQVLLGDGFTVPKLSAITNSYKLKKDLAISIAAINNTTATSIIGYLPFSSKEALGNIPTFDIEVEHPNHTFVLANGAVVSNSTRQAGDLGKQLTTAAADLIVSEKDCGGEQYLTMPVDDPDNEGAYLARDVGGFKANTPISKQVIEELKKQGLTEIPIRSPLTCGSEEGVCQKCAGLNEKGTEYNLRDAIGIIANSALSERIAQGSLNVKHCLDVTTPILMADGSKKCIGDIEPGDTVIAVDEHYNLVPAKVVRVYSNGLRHINRYAFEDNECNMRPVIRGTMAHKIAGETFYTSIQGMYPLENADSFRAIAIKFIDNPQWSYMKYGCATKAKVDVIRCRLIREEYVGLKPTYDLEVDHPLHRFLTADGLIVSNSGGKTSSSDTYSGYEWINRFLQIPKNYQEEAILAPKDGKISNIEKEQTGGYKIRFEDGHEVFVPPGRQLVVKEGDEIEAGDFISSGFPNPYKIVKYKGIGEGRKFFMTKLKELFDASGLKNNRRNIEVTTRAILNYMKIEDPTGLGDYLPGDIIAYQQFAKKYIPRPGTVKSDPRQAVNKYLEKPVLHYTIGTRISKKIADNLVKHGINEVQAHPDKPDFEPYMERLRTLGATAAKGDWQAKLQASYLKSGLQEAAQLGEESNIHGTNPWPAIAYGRELGKNPDVNKVRF